MSTWTPCPIHTSQQVPCRECIFASAEYAAVRARVAELEAKRDEWKAAAWDAALDRAFTGGVIAQYSVLVDLKRANPYRAAEVRR